MNDLGPYKTEMDALLRQCGLGGLLDKHRGETGLTVSLAPTEATDLLSGVDPLGPAAAGLPYVQKDLLQLTSRNRANPDGALVGFNTQIVQEASDVASVGASIQLVVSWGSGKGFANAIVDARIGGQMVIGGNVVNVAVRYVLEAVGNDGPIVRVGANASYGDRPGGNAALTFTTLNTGPLIVNGESGRFRIPNYATRVQWASPGDPGAFIPPSAVLQFRPNAGAVAGGIVEAAPSANEFVAIPNGATNVSIRNEGDVNDSYRLIYELGI